MKFEELLNSPQILSAINKERDLGYSNHRIFYNLRDIYPDLSRSNITNYLKSIGRITSTTHGGYRSGSGRGNKYLYDNIIFDSKGELIYYLYRKQINNPIKKCYESFQLGDHHYTPDFIDSEGTYYEIECLESFDYYGWNQNKLIGFPNKLIIITSDELNKYREKLNSTYTDNWFNSVRWIGSFNQLQSKS